MNYKREGVAPLAGLGTDLNPIEDTLPQILRALQPPPSTGQTLLSNEFFIRAGSVTIAYF